MSLKGNLYLAGLQKIIMIIMIEKSYSFYNVVSVREEFWVGPWLVSHAENVILGAYDDCGHFSCYVVEVRFSMPSSLRIPKHESET